MSPPAPNRKRVHAILLGDRIDTSGLDHPDVVDRRRVTTGVEQGRNVVVTDGLKAGELVTECACVGRPDGKTGEAVEAWKRSPRTVARS